MCCKQQMKVLFSQSWIPVLSKSFNFENIWEIRSSSQIKMKTFANQKQEHYRVFKGQEISEDFFLSSIPPEKNEMFS